MEASRNIFFSHLLTTSALNKTFRRIDLGFFPKNKETMLFAQMGQAWVTLCVENKKVTSLLGLGKKWPR